MRLLSSIILTYVSIILEVVERSGRYLYPTAPDDQITKWSKCFTFLTPRIWDQSWCCSCTLYYYSRRGPGPTSCLAPAVLSPPLLQLSKISILSQSLQQIPTWKVNQISITGGGLEGVWRGRCEQWRVSVVPCVRGTYREQACLTVSLSHCLTASHGRPQLNKVISAAPSDYHLSSLKSAS